MNANIGPFYLQHGTGLTGSFMIESVPVRESWHPQKRRGTVSACRFVILYRGRWRRLYADSAARGLPHFINVDGERVAVSGVAP